MEVQLQNGEVDGPEFYADQLNLILGLSGAEHKDKRHLQGQETKQMRRLVADCLLLKYQYEINSYKMDLIINNGMFCDFISIHLNIQLLITFTT